MAWDKTKSAGAEIREDLETKLTIDHEELAETVMIHTIELALRYGWTNKKARVQVETLTQPFNQRSLS